MNVFNFFTALLISIVFIGISCSDTENSKNASTEMPATKDSLEYFSLRPSLEKMYGYTHAVKIGDDIKISGAVSMDSSGNLLAKGNMEQQMKNCYADLEIILKHYGCTFDDVVVENILTKGIGFGWSVDRNRNVSPYFKKIIA